MKNKIVFIILGIFVIIATVIITDAVNNPVAQQDTQVFNNVLIRGKLVIENGDNKITLENKDGKSNIILDTKGYGIALSAEEDNAIIILTTHQNGNLKLPKGVALNTTKGKATGKINSLMYISDDDGLKLLESTD